MNILDGRITPFNSQLVRLKQNIRMGETLGWFETIARKFDQQAERIFEINRIHKPTILMATVPNPFGLQTFGGLSEHRF